MPLAILLSLNIDPLFAAAAAAILALAISLLFFNPQRNKLSAELYERVQQRKKIGEPDLDSDIENEIIDAQEGLEK